MRLHTYAQTVEAMKDPRFPQFKREGWRDWHDGHHICPYARGTVQAIAWEYGWREACQENS